MWLDLRGVVLVDQVPDEDAAVVASRSQCAAATGGPFDAVYGGGVAAQFDERLAWLADVEDAD